MNFSDKELNELDAHIQGIENIIRAKTFALSSEQRIHYSAIADRNKQIVDQVIAYMGKNPKWVPNFIDKEEFDRDYLVGKHIEARITLLQGLTQQLVDTKTLLDHDNYNNALSFYRMVRYYATKNEPGAHTVYQDIKKLFGTAIMDENMIVAD
ncbi:hypothetical protein ACJRPK_11055 [Aquimarina sp. 2-A2]|uniref:hypothetical protein n=1 Tax=Aquimarina sp. 2-A2 TaxID=3382644 RepID=UPI00387F3187